MKHTKKAVLLLLIAALAVSLMSGAALAAGGEVIADDPLNGSDPLELTVSDPITADSGVGADITANNNPVTVTLAGGVSVEDHGAYGENAIGVKAYAVPGGTLDLTIKNDVSVQSDENIAYGVHLETRSEGIVKYYYVNDEKTIPLTLSNRFAWKATVSKNGTDVTSDYAGGSESEPRVFFSKRADAEDAWDVFLVTDDAKATGWSKSPITEQTIKEFVAYATGEGSSTQEQPITVTICSNDDPDGSELTLEIADITGGACVFYDRLGNWFFSPPDSGKICEITAENDGDEFTLQEFSNETPVIRADIAGLISAEAEKACGMNVLAYRGPIDVTLDNAGFTANGETWAWGINASPTNRMTLTGHDVSITAASDSTGSTASVVGILVKPAMEVTTVDLTGQNTISVSAAAAPGYNEYSGGIVAFSTGASVAGKKAGVSDVRYSGDITASGVGMVGVEALAMLGGTSSVVMFGDVTLTGSDSDGLYAKAEQSIVLYKPKSEIFLRGNVTLNDATADAAGVSANGCPVIVDGDITVSGADTVYGVYADVGGLKLNTQGSTVLVTGTVTAPTAVRIPDAEGNDSRVYVWDYDGAVQGKTENLGFVLKLEDGVDASLTGASLYSVTKEGETYYGADAGDTVTVVTEQADISVLDAHGNTVSVQKTADGYTFTVPADCGAIVTQQHRLILVPATPATCTKDGNEAYYRCEGCGKFFSYTAGDTEIEEDSWIIPAGHSWDDGEITTPAGCETPGEMTYTCTMCGQQRTEEIQKLGHDILDTVTEPTCTAQGYTTHTCARCGATTTDTYTEPLGHETELQGAVPATCVQEGYSGDMVCSRCGEVFGEGTAIPATGHEWDEGTVTTEPTETEDGEMTYLCLHDSNHIRVEVLKALGHSFGEWTIVTEPTCTEEGEETRTCTECGETETRPVPALSHSYTAVVTEPTYTAAGYTTYTCEYCGASYKSDFVDPIAILPGDINNDGETDKLDLWTLAEYLTGRQVEINEAAADVNGDTKINYRDLLALIHQLWDDAVPAGTTALLEDGDTYAAALMLQNAVGLRDESELP